MTASKILFVHKKSDSESQIRQRLRDQRNPRILKYLFARDGFEALAKLKTESEIDVVLTDVRATQIDGGDLIEFLSEINEIPKVVVMSEHEDIAGIRMAMSHGAFDFLIKPIDFQDLEDTIEKALDSVAQIKRRQKQLQKADEKLKFQALYDQITGLPNQKLILDRIGCCLEKVRQGECQFSVLFLNIDNFKAIKYGLGHVVSEQLLVKMANRLETCVSSANVIARVGADEFAILLDNFQDSQQVYEVAHQIHQTLQQPFHLNQVILSTKVYIGIANSTIGYRQPIDFLRTADTAMYAAKTSDDLSICTFTTPMQTNATRRIELESDLRTALANDQLHLNFQPIVSIATGQLIGLEALTRWHHPERGWISPLEFVSLAEETGLIIPLGSWVLRAACQQLSIWREQFPECCPTSINVNLSATQVWHPDFLKLIDETLDIYREHRIKLHLELTENVLMAKGEMATQLLEQLKVREIHLSIDDFGTGYSSLAYLQTFPIDTLKIERSFMRRLEHDRKKLDIVQIIISLAHTLGLEVTAEGIETEEQLTILQSLSCDYGQGYLFSPPLNAQGMTDYLITMGNRFSS